MGPRMRAAGACAKVTIGQRSRAETDESRASRWNVLMRSMIFGSLRKRYLEFERKLAEKAVVKKTDFGTVTSGRIMSSCWWMVQVRGRSCRAGSVCARS